MPNSPVTALPNVYAGTTIRERRFRGAGACDFGLGVRDGWLSCAAMVWPDSFAGQYSIMICKKFGGVSRRAPVHEYAS